MCGMDPVNPLAALACLFAALATSFFLLKRFGFPRQSARFASIDGLRGYLAFFVFLHHACIWYFYLQTGEWGRPPSNLYSHLGRSSVVLFFMITGFLFFTKLLNARESGIDWGQFFVSRFLRLAPLYMFAMALLFSTVFVMTKGGVNEPLTVIAKEIFKWLSFTFLGSPDIDGVEHTSLIMAGVIWTLPYELLFYLTLPAIAVLLRVKAPPFYVLVGILGAAGMIIWHPEGHQFLQPFLGGIAAAILTRMSWFRAFAAGKIAPFMVIACVLTVGATQRNAFDAVAILILFFAFSFIAAGCTLFEILTNSVSQMLGEISYSLYLLHGILLFSVFHFFFEPTQVKSLSPLSYWLLIVCITPMLVCTSFITFKIIESPSMRSVTGLTTWLRAKIVRVKVHLRAAG